MNKNSKPLVTILMTAYNAQRYVSAAVKSILNQTYTNFEFIIIDDDSTDSTSQILKGLKKEDKRIRLVHLKKNIGPSLASNIGIKMTRGKYLARMDADDISTSDRIEKQVRFLNSHPDVAIVGGQCFLINDNDEIVGEKKFPITHREIYDSLFHMNPIQHPSSMINLKLVKKENLMGDNYGLLAHDLDLIFKLSTLGKLANLPDKILYYRQVKNSLSLSNPKKTFWHTVQIRHKAVRVYNYRPSLKGWTMHIFQVAAILILPKNIIFPLYSLLRGLKHYSLSLIDRYNILPTKSLS